MTYEDGDVRARLESLATVSPDAHDQTVMAHAEALLQGPRRSTNRLPLALAAAAVIAVPFAAIVMTGAPTGYDANEPLRSEVRDIVPAPGATLFEAPRALSWPATAGARDYQVVILDAEANAVWRSASTAATTLQLPAEVAADLPSGTVIWRVEPRGAGRPATLGPYDFTLR